MNRMEMTEHPANQPKPVSDRQHQFFRYQLDLALSMPAETRQAFLQTNGWTMLYLRQMAEIDPVRQVTLTPQEAEAKLADLRQRAAARESPGLRQWRERQQQGSMPPT